MKLVFVVFQFEKKKIIISICLLLLMLMLFFEDYCRLIARLGLPIKKILLKNPR